MTLEERIMEDLKAAMKAKDQAAMRGIRAIKAALLLAKTDGSGDAMTPEREIKILQKLVKQRKESLEIYVQQNRADLAQVEQEEIAIIEQYLPKQMDEAELEAALRPIIQEVGATSAKDMGKVMAAASKALAGKADGKMISAVVKKLLE
ncbi:MAG: GatB/YqeY domain-containing protein [Saprospiraceae bacterium]|nr:GatB/YqeY domain-containing protein [Saprospiraceae bacterium]